MNYILAYQKLVERGKNRVRTKNIYLEKHHIQPKCLGGIDLPENITLLTGREHYLTHWLLCKIHKNDKIQIKIKLSCAFNRMCCKNVHTRIINSKQYEIARKQFSLNHPMKNPLIRKKQKDTWKTRSEILRKIKEEQLPFCKCGCGLKVKSKYNSFRREHFPFQQIVKLKNHTLESNKKRSLTQKRYIKDMTITQQKQRLYKSLHNPNINHIMRGKHISQGKKGKKTKQKEIMGKRFAKMSNNQFKDYLKTKSQYVYNRFKNYREEYICKN